MAKIIRRYKTVLHGQEVEVKVYEPIKPEDEEHIMDDEDIYEQYCEVPDDRQRDLVEMLEDEDRIFNEALEDADADQDSNPLD